MNRATLLAATLSLLALAGCGGSSHTASRTPAGRSTAAAGSTSAAQPAAAGALAVSADPGGQLRFTTSSLTAKAGKLTIRFTNMAPVDHNLTIASSSGQVDGATPTFHGGSRSLTVSLQPGTYAFYCSVPGHRQAGMQGTLTVS